MNCYIPKPKLIRQSNNNYIPINGSEWREDKSLLSIVIVNIRLIENVHIVTYKFASKTNCLDNSLTLQEFHSRFSDNKD
jgi:hypothetical protein